MLGESYLSNFSEPLDSKGVRAKILKYLPNASAADVEPSEHVLRKVRQAK
jgi:hypothetical protein